MIPLGNFDIGDVIVINEGETIPLGGKIIKGNAPQIHPIKQANKKILFSDK